MGWLALLLLIATSAFGQSGPGGPRLKLTLDLESSALVVQGAEPSGQVVWFGVQRYLDPDLSVTRVTRSGMAQAGADGVARIVFEKPLAERAIWVAVDLKSGEFVAAAPTGYRLSRASRGHSGHGRGEGEAADSLLEDRSQIAGLMVRPDVGAWRFAAADGGGDDEDGKNDGRMRVALPRFQALTGSPEAPRKLEGRDLWFVIDPLSMDLAVLKGGIEE
jgi:hypothetical protein